MLLRSGPTAIPESSGCSAKSPPPPARFVDGCAGGLRNTAPDRLRDPRPRRYAPRSPQATKLDPYRGYVESWIATTTLLRLATLPSIKTIEQYALAFANGALSTTQADTKTCFISAADLILQLRTARSRGRLRECMGPALGLNRSSASSMSSGPCPSKRVEVGLFFDVIAHRCGCARR